MPPSRLSRPALAATLSLWHAAALAAPALPAMGSDPQGVTVSGLSSGGFMAVQFQIAHSSLVRGAGILAGGPYYCAAGSVSRALANCMAPSPQAPPPSVTEQRQTLDELAKAGRIDLPERLKEHRVWLFSGKNDHTVAPPVMDALAAFYAQLLPAQAIHYAQHPEAGHAMISVADAKPNACAASEPPFINRCQDLDAAGQLLAHLLGPLRPMAATADSLQSFDQRPFVAGKAVDSSLADEGYVYVPKACLEGGCRVHVVFHGCRQGAAEIGRRFVDGAGYNAWAESNRLIVLYPQAIARSGPALGSWSVLYNPKGCWDWWGYSGADYHTRDGAQIRAVKAMTDRLAEPLAH
ncbi:MAG: polyhydroxybutyrate depolymerase [Phaeospirillum sp.]|nr:polyhydroxybutyrate depolymerase [Phaeospirillum sp.]